MPFIHDNELQQEISGRQVSITFDRTTHVSEAIVVVLRYVDDDGRFMVLAKSLAGEEIARLLIETMLLLTS